MARTRAGRRGRRGRAGGVRPLPHRSSVHASVAPGGGRRMSEVSYQYVVLRCVPRVEREEFVNVGVVLHCQATEFLGVAWHVDRERLSAFAPGLDLDRVCSALDYVEGVCRGDARGGAAGSPEEHTSGI